MRSNQQTWCTNRQITELNQVEDISSLNAAIQSNRGNNRVSTTRNNECNMQDGDMWLRH